MPPILGLELRASGLGNRILLHTQHSLDGRCALELGLWKQV